MNESKQCCRKMAAEGASLDIPPLLNGPELLLNFIVWKKRFEVFIKAKGQHLWEIIEFGNYIPCKQDGDVEIVKPISEWSEKDKIKCRENHIVMHMLYCALHDSTLQLVVKCDTAHDVWETLVLIFEGNSGLKDSKIRLLTLEFYDFKMRKSEDIDEMYVRFNRIIISLRALGKSFTNEECVQRFLSALPHKWDLMVSIISLHKDIRSRSIEDVIGKLKAHEIKELREKQLQSMQGM